MEQTSEQTSDSSRRTVALWLLWSPLIILGLCALLRIGGFFLRGIISALEPKSRGVQEFSELLEAWGDAHGYSVLPESSGWETVPDPPNSLERFAFRLLLRAPSGNILPCTLYCGQLRDNAFVHQIQLEEPIPAAALSQQSELIPVAEFIFSTFTPKLVESPETGFGELCYAALHDSMETLLRRPHANKHLFFASRSLYFWESSQTLDCFAIQTPKESPGYTRRLVWVWWFD